MRKLALAGVVAASALSIGSPVAHADRAEPPPLYGYYNVFVDFAKQTFNGMPTPMESKTFPVLFTTTCDVNGCVARMDNRDDQKRNPGAPLEFEYRWNNGRWETSGEQPYLCQRTDPEQRRAIPALGLLDPESGRQLLRRADPRRRRRRLPR